MTSAYGRVSVMRRGSLVTIHNTHLQVVYDLSRGLWSYSDGSGQECVRGIGARWRQLDGKERATSDACHRVFRAQPTESERFGEGVLVEFRHQAEGDPLRMDVLLEVFSDAPFAALKLRVMNEGRASVAIDRLDIVDIPVSEEGVALGGVYLADEPTDCFLYLNGSKSLARRIQEVRKGLVFPDEMTDEPVSDGIIFEPRSQRAVSFGFLENGRWWSTAQLGFDATLIDVNADSHGVNVWRALQYCDGASCAPGSALESGRLYVNVTTSASEAQRYFAEVAFAGREPEDAETPSVTLFLDGDDEENPVGARVEALLEWMRADERDVPVYEGGIRYLRMGHGWAGASHERLTRNFPQGVRATVDSVHEAGLRIAADVHTFLCDRPPDSADEKACIKLRNGQPARFSADGLVNVPAFDPTHPLTEKRLRERFTQAFDEWGLDLIYVSLAPFRDLVPADLTRFRWHESGLTRMELLKRAHDLVKRIHAEVAPERQLGLKDAPQSILFGGNHRTTAGLDEYYRMRSPVWDGKWGLRELIEAYVAKWYLHGFAGEMELGPLSVIQMRTRNEFEILMTLSVLSGGHLVITDELPALEREDLERLRLCLPLTSRAARPVAMPGHGLYGWAQSIRTSFDSWEMLALVNLSDQFQDVDVSLNDLGVSRSKGYVAYEFWDRVFFGVHQRTFSVMSLPPRSAKLFVLREEKAYPIFLASDLHISQGDVELLTVGWDEKSESLLGVCRGPQNGRGVLFFYVPDEFVPATASCVGAKYSYEWKPPIFELRVALGEAPAPFHIRFARTAG